MFRLGFDPQISFNYQLGYQTDTVMSSLGNYSTLFNRIAFKVKFINRIMFEMSQKNFNNDDSGRRLK